MAKRIKLTPLQMEMIADAIRTNRSGWMNETEVEQAVKWFSEAKQITITLK